MQEIIEIHQCLIYLKPLFLIVHMHILLVFFFQAFTVAQHSCWPMQMQFTYFFQFSCLTFSSIAFCNILHAQYIYDLTTYFLVMFKSGDCESHSKTFSWCLSG